MGQGYSEKSGKEFNRISEDYDLGRSSENIEFWAKETSSLKGINQNSLVQELGYGTGLYTIGIRNECKATLCGIDPVPGMLKQAKCKNSEIHWFNGSVKTCQSVTVYLTVFSAVRSGIILRTNKLLQTSVIECYDKQDIR